MKFLPLCLLALVFAAAPVFAADNPFGSPTQDEIRQHREEIQKRQLEMKKIADTNIAQAQARTVCTLNDLLTLFPDAFKQPSDCYQAALSNYVDDQWESTKKDITCPTDHPDCGKDTASDESMRKTLLAMHMNAEQIEQSLRPMVALNVANATYKSMLPLLWSLSPDNKVDSFNPAYVRDKNLMKIPDVPADALQARKDEFMKYLATCSSRKPAEWLQPNAEYADLSATSIPPFKLGLTAILMQHLLGGQLPDDKKGYVGCLTRFDRLRTEFRNCSDDKCIAAIPVDDKTALMKQLDDLKTQHCDETAAKKLAYRLESGTDALPMLSKAEQRQKISDDNAELAITKSRTQIQQTLNDLSLFFGKQLKYSKTCYQAALSSYVEDRWQSTATEAQCTADALCATTPSDKKSVTWDYLADLMQGQMRDMTIARRTIAQQNVLTVATAIYNYLHPIDYALEPGDRIDSFTGSTGPRDKKSMGVPDISDAELKKRVDDLRHYLASCENRKPAAWSVIGNNLDDSALFESSVKLGIYNLMLKTVVAGEVPLERAGFVGCIATLDEARTRQRACTEKQCAETLLPTDKNLLGKQLEDLKAHKCTAGYAALLVK